MLRNDVVIVRVRKTSTGATDELVQAESRSSQEIIEWHLIVGRNVTASTTVVELGLKGNSDEYVVKAGNQAAADRTVQIDITVVAPGDFHPYVRFSNPSSGDMLELFAYGHIMHGEE